MDISEKAISDRWQLSRPCIVKNLNQIQTTWRWVARKQQRHQISMDNRWFESADVKLTLKDPQV